MPLSMTKQADNQILTLEGAVTIRDARKLALLLEECLEENGPIRVKTGSLTDVDTPILQCLCSLKKTVSELSFDDPNGILLSALDRSQLRRALLGAREDL
jgi:hypothetical protein